jgi:hypothetical protein
VLALKFALGSVVRVKDDGETRLITSVELNLDGSIIYGLDFGSAIWVDDELESDHKFEVGNIVKLAGVTHTYRIESFVDIREPTYRVRKLPDAPLPMIVREELMSLAEGPV